MIPHASKQNAAPDPVRLVEARDGLDEFIAEHAGQSPLRPPESRQPRANRVQAPPPLLWTDEPASHRGGEPPPESMAAPAPVATPQLSLGVGLEERRDDQARFDRVRARFDWVRLAGRAALVALVLFVVAAGILMLRTSPPRSLASLATAAVDVLPPDASPPALPAPPPAVRDPQPARALTVDREAPPVSAEPPVARPGSAGPPASKALSTSPTAVRTQSEPTLQKQPPAPVVAWLRPETEIRTAPVSRVDEARAQPAPSAAAPPASSAPVAPPASPAPVTPVEVPSRDSATAVAPAAVPEAPRSTVAAPPATAPPATASSSRAPEPPRAAPREAPVAVAPPPSVREVDTRAIEAVLGRYRNGFNSLSASSVSAVWPSVNEDSLAKAFERIEDQNVSFDSCEIEIGGVGAQANCRGTARYVPRVGNKTPKDEARRWRFTLRRTADGWIIDQVVAR